MSAPGATCRVMSASLQKADIGWRQVRFVPTADIVACAIYREMGAVVRGRTILISVNSPGCVSTSIDPPCCLTMMS